MIQALSKNIKYISLALVFFFVQAYTQNDMPRRNKPRAIKRSLKDCKTYNDTIDFYKVNSIINLGIVKIRLKKYRANNPVDSLPLTDTLNIDSLTITE